MEVKIKICGLKTLEDIEAAYKNGAYWYGLVFYHNSHRNISIEQANYLILNSPPKIKPVAVTVNEKVENIIALSKLGIKTIQLHGQENINFCKYLVDKLNLEVIKGINVHSHEDLKIVDKYSDCADWILFDYKDKNTPGGSGNSFDWNILKNNKLKSKWILSGGLNHNNVLSALRTTSAKAVDISSGVEDKHGNKSKKLIKSFCEKISNYREDIAC